LNNYKFSLAGYDDVPEIASLYGSLIGTPGCTWSSEYPNEESAKSDVEKEALYILKMDHKIVAVASMGDFNELSHLQWSMQKPCELARIGVVSAMQNQGVGTAILQNVIRIAKDKGFDGMRLLVSRTNPAAMALYEKNGFEKCGQAFMYGIDFYCYQAVFDTAV
jgi:ribosomal protein S18 acetylase RimI-like enzyme